MDQLNVIASVIFTLNKLEVRGKENLNSLLGCIQALEKLKNTMEQEVTKNAAENQ